MWLVCILKLRITKKTTLSENVQMLYVHSSLHRFDEVSVLKMELSTSTIILYPEGTICITSSFYIIDSRRRKIKLLKCTFFEKYNLKTYAVDKQNGAGKRMILFVH